MTNPALAPALQHSRYLSTLVHRSPEIGDLTSSKLNEPFTATEMERALAQASDDEAQYMRQLRRLRQSVMARLVARELAGLSTLDEALLTVSTLADVTVNHALAWTIAHETRYGHPIGEESGCAQQLIVVGMGKLGGYELNVSSDIDLIFVYEEDGETDGARRIGNNEYFTYIGRKLIRLLDEVTEDGFVFRVDMRLRPFGDSGPLVCSLAALEHYLLTQGREWERYAWTKGRAMAGPQDGLMALVTPFVYRKYLDYGAYASMRELHAQIRREVARRELADNIKIGPGGIREIEFTAQVFQLIRGGRNLQLRDRSTRATLAELGRIGQLPADVVERLQAAYAFLRNLEHRIMYLDDAQTQNLPTNDADRERIALSMGFADWAAFSAELQSHRQYVTRQFEDVFADDGQQNGAEHQQLWTGCDEGDQRTDWQAAGFGDGTEEQRRLAALRQSNRYQQLSDRNRKRIDRIVPALIEAAAATATPGATLGRLIDLIEAIGRRESYLALLAEHPQTLKRLATLCGASPWLAQYLTRHPILLDELLDPRLLTPTPDWDALARELNAELERLGDDVEAKMDALRHFQHAQTFRLAAQDIGGLLTLEVLSDHLSALADIVIDVTIRHAWRELTRRHRDEPHFAAIGYGKLGGKELGYASDLDLVFLYDDDHPDAGEIYARLAKKIVNWLTTSTAAGTLYDIDLRLRPNGSSGLLVSSVESFAEYQQKSAWVWEHQALTRARFVAGTSAIGAAFEAMRIDLLCQPRDLAALKQEVVQMRERISETHPPREVDVKYCAGGIVDIEFIVQYLVLGFAHAYRDLTANRGNIALLATAAQHGLIDATLADTTRNTYRELRRLQHGGRLSGQALTSEALAPIKEGLVCARALWDSVLT
ncbi:bifunctional [glutamate--ammonia ligase]-adenylyl-L-tyrosine phosphorylase/[glutamate--ammonia-ligase] adenylyltransferase [Chitinibacteraceae bacterium HSL-7]